MLIPEDSLSLSGSMLLRSSRYCSGDRGHPVSGTSTIASSKVASSGSGPSQSIPYRSNSSWVEGKNERKKGRILTTKVNWDQAVFLSFLFLSQKLQQQAKRVTPLDLFTFFHRHLLQLAGVSWKLAYSLLSGKWLHKRMWMNWKCSHSWTRCSNLHVDSTYLFLLIKI